MHRKNLIGILVIIVGIGLIAFPHIKNQYYYEKQKKIVEQLKYLEDKSAIDIISEQDSSIQIINKKDDHWTETNNEAYDITLSVVEDTIGTIQIPEIELELPLFNKITEYNLNIGPCWMEQTTEVGKEGNFVIAGHRNYQYGKQFNRLNELEEGNTITIITNHNKKYFYEIREKFIVMPEDTWVTESVSDEYKITLITCDPINTGENRLIIQGVLKESY